MANCCKVIVTFIGHRPTRTPTVSTNGRCRSGNHFQDHGDATGVLEMLEEVRRLECELDSGMPMDTVLVCNGGWPSEANEFINSIDGTKTAGGVWKILERDNTGLSFGGYSYAFELLRNKYKYWIFTEDDVLFVKPGYASDSLKAMRDNRCHYVTPLRICDRHRCPHVTGGIGFTRRYVLDRVAEQFGGKLPYADMVPNIRSDGGFKHSKFCIRGEVALTNTIVQLGMELGVVPGNLVSLYYNWKSRS